MNHDQLQYFVVLADELHFGTTSRRLTVSTSTLSRRVAELERTLGVRLFDRSSRRVKLTPAGAALLEPARRTLNEISAFDSVAREVADGRVGAIRALYSPGNGPAMVSLVRQLRAERPDVDITLEQRISVDVLHAVATGEVDVALCRSANPGRLGSVLMSRDRYNAIVMSVDHPLVDREVITLSDLNHTTLIGPYPAMSQHLSHPDQWAALGVELTMRFERVADEADLMDRVAAGYGLCLVPVTLAERNRRHDLVIRPFDGPVAYQEDRLVWRSDNDDPVVAAFIRVARTLAVEAHA